MRRTARTACTGSRPATARRWSGRSPCAWGSRVTSSRPRRRDSRRARATTTSWWTAASSRRASLFRSTHAPALRQGAERGEYRARAGDAHAHAAVRQRQARVLRQEVRQDHHRQGRSDEREERTKAACTNQPSGSEPHMRVRTPVTRLYSTLSLTCSLIIIISYPYDDKC